MATHDLVIANDTMPTVRGDLNAGLQALGAQQSGTADPSTMYAYQRQARTDLGVIRRRNAANAGWVNDGTLAETFVVDRSSNTILGTADFQRVFRATAGFTQTLTAAATLGDGWCVDYRVESGATLVLDPNSSETVDGATTKSIVGPASGRICCNGTAFYTIGFATAVIAAASLVGAVVPFVGMINGTIVPSRTGSAETIAIKTLAGADPSASDPVIFVFRNVTAGTGDYVYLTATAALSVTVSSGSTLGAANGIPFRVWLTVFNDAGTLRLGVVNCLSGTSILSLKDDDLRSSTAEGGAGAADSAQVIYTGTAVTSKAMRVLGYLEYTLVTAGAWIAAPGKVQLFGPGVPLPGTVVQSLYESITAGSTNNTQTPYDNTIPQNTEGTQVGSGITLTPAGAANVLVVEGSLNFSSSVDDVVAVLALFQDSTANALRARAQISGQQQSVGQITAKHRMVAGSTASTTFKQRVGPVGAYIIYVNRDSGATDIFGGVCESHLEVMEIMA